MSSDYSSNNPSEFNVKDPVSDQFSKELTNQWTWYQTGLEDAATNILKLASEVSPSVAKSYLNGYFDQLRFNEQGN